MTISPDTCMKSRWNRPCMTSNQLVEVQCPASIARTKIQSSLSSDSWCRPARCQKLWPTSYRRPRDRSIHGRLSGRSRLSRSMGRSSRGAEPMSYRRSAASKANRRSASMPRSREGQPRRQASSAPTYFPSWNYQCLESERQAPA